MRLGRVRLPRRISGSLPSTLRKVANGTTVSSPPRERRRPASRPVYRGLCPGPRPLRRSAALCGDRGHPVRPSASRWRARGAAWPADRRAQVGTNAALPAGRSPAHPWGRHREPCCRRTATPMRRAANNHGRHVLPGPHSETTRWRNTESADRSAVRAKGAPSPRCEPQLHPTLGSREILRQSPLRAFRALSRLVHFAPCNSRARRAASRLPPSAPWAVALNMLPLSILLRRIAVRLTGYAAIASRTHGEKFGLSSASGDRWRTDCVATIAAGTLVRVSHRDEKSSLNRFWLPGTTGIRRSPRPLWAEDSSNASGASRGEDANVSLGVIASQRVGAKRRPMTGSA